MSILVDNSIFSVVACPVTRQLPRGQGFLIYGTLSRRDETMVARRKSLRS